jgi:hypothetical protein
VVDIDIIDRPLQVSDLKLQLSFSVETTPQLNPALDELAFRAVAPLTGTASDDLAALLDAMSSSSTNPTAFEQARSARNWRSVLAGGLDPSLPGAGLRTMLHDWMRTGLERLSTSGAIQGTLGAPDAQGLASLTLASVLELTPLAAGFALQNAATVSAETDDLLRVGTTLAWSPSPFLSAEASAAAIAEDPAHVSSAAGGMAQKFGCDNVAVLLADAGATPGQAYPGCNEACMLSLCQDAMTLLWSRVTASNLPSVPWQISGATHAQVDSDARPKLVDGNWVGSLTLSDLADTPIQGLIAGSSPSP